ncbi:MAG: DUF1587 domain-containing protein, partial [Lentisphaeraceae bacterium]|nr:DUF1587 domain-containing protein [Lentisphaeraceae bacterium]
MLKTLLVYFGLVFFQLSAASLDNTSKAFLEKHCYDCHDEDMNEGNLNLADLKFDPENKYNLDKWVKVFDQVSTGDMPPKKKKRPEKLIKEKFLTSIGKTLYLADAQQQVSQGRTRLRRLNRYEFESTLEDIFDMELDIVEDLPEDGKGHGFDTNGAALNVSSVQMESYLNVIDKVLNKATKLHPEPSRNKYELSYLQTAGIMEQYRVLHSFQLTDEGPIFQSSESQNHLSSELAQYTVPYSGRYKVAVKAKVINSEKPLVLAVRMGGRGHKETNDVPKKILGYESIIPGAMQTFNYESHLTRSQLFRVYPANLAPIHYGHKDWKGMQHTYKGPGILVNKLIVDGPIIDKWPPKSHDVLWQGIERVAVTGVSKRYKNPNFKLDKPPRKIAVPRDRLIPNGKDARKDYKTPQLNMYGDEKIYRNAKEVLPIARTMKLSSQNPLADAKRLITRFAPRAFRRTVSTEELEPYLDLVELWLEQGATFEESVRVAYKAILTSPEFLYHKSDTSEAKSMSLLALSERLAYFLWSSKPDYELLESAYSGRLADSKELYRQVERMLEDSR